MGGDSAQIPRGKGKGKGKGKGARIWSGLGSLQRPSGCDAAPGPLHACMPPQAATGCLTVPIFVGPALLSELLWGRPGVSSFQGLSGALGELQKLRGSSGCVLSAQASSVCWASPRAASHLLEGSCQFPVQLDSWRGGTRLLCTPLHPTPPPSAPRRIPQGLSVCSRECTHVDSLEVALYMPGPRLQVFVFFFFFGSPASPPTSPSCHFFFFLIWGCPGSNSASNVQKACLRPL